MNAIAVRSPPPASLIMPTTGEPIAPARFPHMLMIPIDTAAADEVSVMVGSTQNGEYQKLAKKPTRHSHANTTPHGCPGTSARVRNSPVPSCPAMQCHLRSPVRSDDQPDTSTPRNPHRNTRPVQFSTLVGSAPRSATASSPCTTVASQNTNTYPPMLVARIASASSHTFRVRSACAERTGAGRGACAALRFERAFEPVALLRREPLRVPRPVRQQERHRDAEQHGRGTLDQEHPLPALQVEPVLFEQFRGDAGAECEAQGHAEQHHRHRPARSLRGNQWVK